jgi:hypothetical protein
VRDGPVNSMARHGSRHGANRTATCGGAVANGKQWTADAAGGRAARGLPRKPTDIVHRRQHARRTDPWTRAGLGVRVR